jgi:hypothetical protein
MFHLICVNPFAEYTKGQLVTNAKEVEKLLEDRAHHFVKVAAPQEAAPAPKTKTE